MEYVADLAHKLKTPLLIIHTHSSEEMNPLSEMERPELLERMDNIHRVADTTLRTMHHLVQLSRVDAGQVKVKRRRIDLGLLVKRMETDLTALVPKHELNFKLAPALCLADPFLMREVLFCLVDNAAKFSPEKSLIDVTVRSSQTKALLTVKDQGMGIVEKDIDRIFERHFQSKRNKRNPGSAGLGLNLVK